MKTRSTPSAFSSCRPRVAGRVDPLFVDEVDAMADAIAEQARDGDVVIVMGAGSIGAVAAQVAERMKS